MHGVLFSGNAWGFVFSAEEGRDIGGNAPGLGGKAPSPAAFQAWIPGGFWGLLLIFTDFLLGFLGGLYFPLVTAAAKAINQSSKAEVTLTHLH